MSQAYERLSIQKFGEHLLTSLDLDPVYVALDHCIRHFNWEPEKVARWLLAYWCLYHVGAACWLSDVEDTEDYWKALMTAAVNKDPAPAGLPGPNGEPPRWPRSAERRHWRGAAAVRCVEQLAQRYGTAKDMVEFMKGPTVAAVMARAKDHYLFGDWIAFKVADMLERVLGHPVSFDQGHVFMFDAPREAALMLWRKEAGQHPSAQPLDLNLVLEKVVAKLTQDFAGFKAPPRLDRPVGLQEIETILCKWKSHMNAHYPLWHDIEEINHGLDQWTGESEAAAAFAVAMPKRAEGVVA